MLLSRNFWIVLWYPSQIWDDVRLKPCWYAYTPESGLEPGTTEYRTYHWNSHIGAEDMMYTIADTALFSRDTTWELNCTYRLYPLLQCLSSRSPVVRASYRLPRLKSWLDFHNQICKTLQPVYASWHYAAWIPYMDSSSSFLLLMRRVCLPEPVQG